MLRLCLVIGCLWSPALLLAQESMLHVSSASGNPEILLLTGEGEPTNLTNNPAADTYPAWSPDGKRIAFCSNRDGATNVYVMNADGTEVTRITDVPRGGKAFCVCPSWSPDGESIAYQRRDGGEGSDLITIHIESGRTRVLTDDAWDPVWSPGGDKILFTGRTPKGWSLYTIEPDGAKLTEIVSMSGSVGFIYPSWSPDGKRIAFTQQAGMDYEVHIADADGQNVKPVTKAGKMNTHSVWSPDGKRLLFWHDNDGKLWQWMSVEIDGGKSEPLAGIKPEAYVHGGRIAVR